MNTFQNVARQANKVVAPLLQAPVVGALLGRSMAELTYTGRRSGKTYHLVVNYKRKADDEIVVGVALPDKKTWWRNFYPDPGPILVRLDGVDRPGTAVAKRSEKGTGVRIVLQPLGLTDAADHPGATR
ncbi:MAG: nitroreductase/quinone reductase family protein [Gordonia sp. (in: high G+C Gram-positive bacteria)]|uniref:nitroreductase/quinone reductase family protein n=1 Tax=Gordonia sp. (in: high G+C Gram-positive bacteria) TaxID=84139 RepID=UPI0039E5321A